MNTFGYTAEDAKAESPLYLRWPGLFEYREGEGAITLVSLTFALRLYVGIILYLKSGFGCFVRLCAVVLLLCALVCLQSLRK